MRQRPEAKVLTWFEDVPDEALSLNVLTPGEIRKGVEGLGDGEPRKKALHLWLENDLLAWFGDRLLAVSPAVADR